MSLIGSLTQRTSTASLAIVGSGPTAVYLLTRLLDDPQTIAGCIERITILEKAKRLGVGMPYSEAQSAPEHLSNISSAELPPLPQSFADWLRRQPDGTLRRFGIVDEKIDESETYPRVALGAYFAEQWSHQVERLRQAGLRIDEEPDVVVRDVIDDPDRDQVIVETSQGGRTFDGVLLCTGHQFGQADQPQSGYYDSPWPIAKVLPAAGDVCNFTIGTLGASLSAFDVVKSLALRHGEFICEGDRFRFRPAEHAPDFRVVMHSADGWLPHLQYEQREPFRELYRHVDRSTIAAMIKRDGWLRLDAYFDEVMRPALRGALRRDKREDLVAALEQDDFGLDDFVRRMIDEHESDNPFQKMWSELSDAAIADYFDKPIHWMETLDDLMYTLNFHAERMPAEDHIALRKVVMPFLTNVIAALPLDSARILLALHRAERLELASGRITATDKQAGKTVVEIEREGKVDSREYRLFINCAGQPPVRTETFPFPSLVKEGTVMPPTIDFADSSCARQARQAETKGIREEHGRIVMELDGIAVDADYHVIGRDGRPNRRIQDLAFPHATGVRPYSYGLQACNETARAAVWGSPTWTEATQPSTIGGEGNHKDRV